MPGSEFLNVLKAKSINEPIILALDAELNNLIVHKLSRIRASGFSPQIKIGWLPILEIGIGKVVTVLRGIFSDDSKLIVDIKLGDIPYMGGKIVRKLGESGANAIIVHGIVGPDFLKETSEAAYSAGLGFLIVADMTHKGAAECYSKCSNRIISWILNEEIKFDGLILPATRPHRILEFRRYIGSDKLILVPGVGAQGGKVKDVMSAGADFMIIGRLILGSDKPEEEYARFLSLAKSLKARAMH